MTLPFRRPRRDSANTQTAPMHGPADEGTPPRRRISSHDLLAGGIEVEIDHAGAIYRLRLTSLGKLILTK